MQSHFRLYYLNDYGRFISGFLQFCLFKIEDSHPGQVSSPVLLDENGCVLFPQDASASQEVHCRSLNYPSSSVSFLQRVNFH